MMTGWIVIIALAVATYFALDRLRKRASSSNVRKLKGPGTYDLEVVGESHYQKALEELCGGRSEESANEHVLAALVLDDNNKYDKKAVRVEIEGHLVGHLSRDAARAYRKGLAEAGHPNLTGVCDALIVGGWDRGRNDRGHFGVRLDLPVDE